MPSGIQSFPISCCGWVGLCAAALTIMPMGGCDQNEPQTGVAATAPGTEASTAMKESNDGQLPPCCQPSEEASPVNSRVKPEALNEPPGSAAPIPTEPIQLPDESHMASSIVGYKPDLDASFTNEDGRPVNLARDYPGQALVITTIYTTCPMPTMCPRLGQDFSRLAKEVPSDLRDKIRFILISFDPQRDTPEVLKAWGQVQGIDFAVTDLLCGDIEATKKIIINELQIDVSVDPQTNMIYNHAMMLQIVNKDGYIVVERAVKDPAQMDIVAKEMIRAATMPFSPESVEQSEPSDG